MRLPYVSAYICLSVRTQLWSAFLQTPSTVNKTWQESIIRNLVVYSIQLCSFYYNNFKICCLINFKNKYTFYQSFRTFQAINKEFNKFSCFSCESDPKGTYMKVCQPMKDTLPTGFDALKHWKYEFWKKYWFLVAHNQDKM